MLDINTLLMPLAGNSGTGDDLTFSPEFDAIQEARRADDATLDQGEWITTIKEADWQQVIGLSTNLIATRSKDLRLGMWLTEALGKQHGFAGLTQGLQLMGGLCQQYWSDVHPAPEEGDQELRIGSLTWLLSRLAQLFREIPITNSADLRYSTQDHDAALQLSRQVANNPNEAAALTAGKLTLEQFQKAQQGTAKSFYQQLWQDVNLCQQQLYEFEKVVDTQLGNDGPGFANTKTSLTHVMALIEHCAVATGAINKKAAASKPDNSPASAVNAVANSTGNHVQGPIDSREHALARLNEVADFFRRTEPHSPVAYLVTKAVHWGNMPLHVWLRSVVKDPASLSHLEEMLGMPAQSAPPPAE